MTGMHLIRRAERQDAESVQAIFARAISDAQWLAPEARSNVDFAKVSEGEVVLVCCTRDNSVLGFVSVYEPGSFIHHLYVAPHCQRQGVGAALLVSLEAWGPMQWHLKCVAANKGALAFYRAQGWTEESRAFGPDGPYVLLQKGAA